jgi:hypothetical protein
VKVTDTTNKEIDASTSSDSENESFEITRIDTNESSYQDIVSLLPEVRDMKRHRLGLRGLRNRSLNSTIT